MTAVGKPRIIFRSDNTFETEFRRFSRTLELAKSLAGDFDCVIALSAPLWGLQAELSNVGIDLIHLRETADGLDEFLSLLKGNEIVVVDSSHFPASHQRRVKDAGCSLVCIDVFAKEHFACDAIINFNEDFAKENYSVEPYTLIYTLRENSSLVKDPASPHGLSLQPMTKLFSSLILTQTTRLRRALMDDIDLVYGWINDPEVRKQSYHQEFITQEEHRQWFTSMISNENSYYYVFEVGGIPTGQIRFDLRGSKFVMHNLLSPEARGKGLNVILMRTGIDRALQDATVEITNLHGYIKAVNVASCEVFRNLPFNRIVSTEYPDSYKVFYHFKEHQQLPLWKAGKGKIIH